MAILKRFSSEVGSSQVGGSRTASASTICPHCQKQTRPALVDGRRVCALCGKPLGS